MVELTWKSEHGEKLFGHCRGFIDITENGVAVRVPGGVANSFQRNYLKGALVPCGRPGPGSRHCTWQSTIYVLGLRFLAPDDNRAKRPVCGRGSLRTPACLSPGAEPEAVLLIFERVYRKLAKRFHPDNPETGDAPRRFFESRRPTGFCRIRGKRTEYDAERVAARTSPRFQFRSAEFFSGVLGEQNRRMAILCLLYRKRTSNYEDFPACRFTIWNN